MNTSLMCLSRVDMIETRNDAQSPRYDSCYRVQTELNEGEKEIIIDRFTLECRYESCLSELIPELSTDSLHWILDVNHT